MRILCSNDDGIAAEGLSILVEVCARIGEVTCVAPDREQSAMSHALTMDRPVRLRQLGEGIFSVDGTPTDCVVLAVRGIPGVMKIQPDLIVSGINHGANLGDDVLYSGTVAAAAEGCLMGIPALAWAGDKFKTLADIEKSYMQSVLNDQEGSRKRTAAILGIDRKTLWAKIKKYGLEGKVTS